MDPATTINVEGIGELTYQRAIDLARNTEGPMNPHVSAYLERALHHIWHSIAAQPDTYIMSRDEFAVFNFYRFRFADNKTAEMAIDRFWKHTTNRPFPGS